MFHDLKIFFHKESRSLQHNILVVATLFEYIILYIMHKSKMWQRHSYRVSWWDYSAVLSAVEWKGLNENVMISREDNSKVLCFDLRPGPKNAIPRWCTERKWHIPMAVRRGNRVGGNWLMKWDEQEKFPWYTTEWCTGREWPLNCMTVISAWWRLNIRFQRSSGRSCRRWTII